MSGGGGGGGGGTALSVTSPYLLRSWDTASVEPTLSVSLQVLAPLPMLADDDTESAEEPAVAAEAGSAVSAVARDDSEAGEETEAAAGSCGGGGVPVGVGPPE